MAEANWYWAENGQQNGPVLPGVIAKLVADGKLGADDLIWKEGMAEWIPVSRVPALVKYLKNSIATAPQQVAAQPEPEPKAMAVESTYYADPEPAPVGYYNPSGALPPRAAATLDKHAAPRGDIGDWPLDDLRVNQFDSALKLRKKIDRAASLFRLMLFLTAIGDAIVLTVGVFSLVAGSGSANSVIAASMVGAAAVTIAFTVLYYFTWISTVRSQAWAPLTMGILFILAAIFDLAMIAIVPTRTTPAPMQYSRNGMPIRPAPTATTDSPIAAVIAVIVVMGLFAYICFSAFVAIPKYLRQPAWCQELLSKTTQKSFISFT